MVVLQVPCSSPSVLFPSCVLFLWFVLLVFGFVFFRFLVRSPGFSVRPSGFLFVLLVSRFVLQVSCSSSSVLFPFPCSVSPVRRFGFRFRVVESILNLFPVRSLGFLYVVCSSLVEFCRSCPLVSFYIRDHPSCLFVSVRSYIFWCGLPIFVGILNFLFVM
jgi:hypothetical protein